MPLFKPGQKPGPGRPKGSKPKVYLKLSYWFGLIEENKKSLTPKEQIDLGKWGFRLLTDKLKEMPRDPEESLENATETLKQIEAKLEAKVNKEVKQS